MVAKVLNTYGQALVVGAIIEPIIKEGDRRDFGVTIIVIAVGIALHVVAYYVTQDTSAEDDDE